MLSERIAGNPGLVRRASVNPLGTQRDTKKQIAKLPYSWWRALDFTILAQSLFVFFEFGCGWDESKN